MFTDNYSPMPNIKPFLKWAGGKYRLLDRILPEMPAARRYIEPFSGSAAVYLNVQASYAIINDMNTDLVSLFIFIQTEGDSFIEYASNYFIPENNTENAYYRLRDTFNKIKDKRQKAAIFVYLNKHAFNGLIRYNAQGFYNVPFGKYKAPKFPYEEMRNFCKRTQQGDTIFSCQDFRAVLDKVGDGDVVYCDPPYVPLSTTANFTAYTGQLFGAKDQEELAYLTRKAYKNGATIILSNHDTPQIRKLYHDAHILSFDVQRFISCKGNERNKAPEILAIYKQYT